LIHELWENYWRQRKNNRLGEYDAHERAITEAENIVNNSVRLSRWPYERPVISTTTRYGTVYSMKAYRRLIYEQGGKLYDVYINLCIPEASNIISVDVIERSSSTTQTEK
ncbi:MAG TPA: hypothetical protein VGB16_05160, partial [candidate division Zixibacteria bacterium]